MHNLARQNTIRSKASCCLDFSFTEGNLYGQILYSWRNFMSRNDHILGTDDHTWPISHECLIPIFGRFDLKISYHPYESVMNG